MSKKQKAKKLMHQKLSLKEQSKVGKRPDDIFSKPALQEKPAIEPIVNKTEVVQPEEEITRQSRGRPQEHQESWSKVTVVLLDKQIHWLDQLASTIRLKTRAAVSRAELLRAMIAATEESGIDLSNVSSEIEIKNYLLEKLKK